MKILLFFVISPKGSMYKENKKGPNTEPCGVPSVTDVLHKQTGRI